MNFTILTAALLAILLPFAKADFDVFMVDFENQGGYHYKRWQIWDRNQPNTCTSVFDRINFVNRVDASGSNFGFRCKGACGYLGPTRDIQELEMNFQQRPLYHWKVSVNWAAQLTDENMEIVLLPRVMTTIASVSTQGNRQIE
ncbi:uncharacterized protein QYS62_011349 [Fusarium acuminatum]|uniref:Uncharacterized protein n=1 Tax=Fusarium acuminatum TaxID=5515 RepID=A0ABZ2XAG7_9HYPO